VLDKDTDICYTEYSIGGTVLSADAVYSYIKRYRGDNMVNEKKVKVMTKMAMYENGQGAEDIKINSYYRNDYVSFKTLVSIIWMTIGYVMLVAMVAGMFLDEIMEQISVNFLFIFIMVIVSLYLALVLLYAIGASRFYKKRYLESRQRLKKFNHYLTRLNRMYEKEKR